MDNKNLENTRKAIHYYIDSRKEDSIENSFLNFMLIDDMHLAIMPLNPRSNAKLRIEITPYSKDIEDLIMNGLITQFGKAWDLKESVCNFVNELAHSLVYFGKVYYEIVYYFLDIKKIDYFEFQRIPNDFIHSCLKFYWQFFPKNKQKKINKFNFLQKDRIMFISIPKELGGYKRYRNTLRSLYSIRESFMPEFALNDMMKQKSTKGYNYLMYYNCYEEEVAKITRRFGWNARGTFQERSSEYYYFYRVLKFNKTKAILREHIIKNLNKSLREIGKIMHFDANILIKGLPTSKDYDRYLKELNKGTLQFKDIIYIEKNF
jgi:hypothetical protein